MSMATTKTNVDLETNEITTEEAGAQINKWEFMGRSPSREEVLALLASHRDQWGTKYEDFGDYVQALPQNKKIKRKDPNNPKVFIEAFVEVWTLYVSVAGRQAMLQQMAQDNGWQVNFIPEPVTPTGIPGMLEFEDRIVYREYCEIKSMEGNLNLGKKPGTAWVPRAGGQGAVASNPYEKVETSARGRSIAAWGIGILPGSGIASLEEIQAVLDQKAQNYAGQNQRPTQSERRPSRGQLLILLEAALQAYSEKNNLPYSETLAHASQVASNNTGLQVVVDGDKLDASNLKDGQIVMLTNAFTA